MVENRLWTAALVTLAACSFSADGTGEAGSSGSGGSSGQPTTTSTDTSTTGSSSEGSATATTATTTTTTSEPTTGGTGSSTTDDGTSSTDGTTGGSTGEVTASSTGSMDVCHPVVAEAFVSVAGADSGREWVVLYNPCPQTIDLSGYSVGWGRNGFDGSFDLQGSVASTACFVIGGPTSDAGNFMPMYDQTSEFDPQLFISYGGVGLYELPAGSVSTASIPVDILVWGSMNNANWTDTDGNVAAVDAPAWPADVSLQRTGFDTWQQADPPTPNGCPSFTP